MGPKGYGIEKIVKYALIYAYLRNKVLVALYINMSGKSSARFVLNTINEYCNLKVSKDYNRNRLKEYAEKIHKKLLLKEAY
jgi:hypothetical protein